MKPSVLMVIAPNQFRDEELLVPRSIFQNEGWNVTLASTRTGEAKGMLGAIENVSATIDNLKADDYDAIVVVGGMGSPEFLWKNQTLHALLKALAAKSKVVSAICLSGAVLANAGVLQGKKATVWEIPESKQALLDGGAQYTSEACVIDGNIVTASGPEAAEAFGKAIVQTVKAAIPA